MTSQSAAAAPRQNVRSAVPPSTQDKSYGDRNESRSRAFATRSPARVPSRAVFVGGN